MYKRELLFWAKQSFFMYLSFWHDLIYSSCEGNVFYDYKFVCLLVSPLVRNPRMEFLYFCIEKYLIAFPGFAHWALQCLFRTWSLTFSVFSFPRCYCIALIYHVGRFLSLHWFLLLCLHLGRR